jgi:RHS repeat-associated protein
MAVDANNTMAWQHTNVYAAGKLFATYDSDGLHFYFNDVLGTRRVQTDYAGVLEQSCSGLPFGDSLSCGNSIQFPTEHHFTGKERDTESGLDYFGARYYASSMGRWMSPDWAAKPEAVPYSDLDDPQSLNLYGYVRDNPSSRFDPDGHNDFTDWWKSQWQRLDNAVRGLGFHTDAQVETNVHNANLALRKNGISTEGLKDRQVLGMAAGLGRPSAAQARAIWEKATGQRVPYDEQLGRYYDMHHKTPITDGGAPRDPNNLEPLQRDEHVKLHQHNNDFSRWSQEAAAEAEAEGAAEDTKTILTTVEILTDLDDIP